MLHATLAAIVLAAPTELPIVTVDRDDIVIRESCRLVFPATPIADANGNGVVQIEGSGIIVDLNGGTLLGAALPPGGPAAGPAGGPPVGMATPDTLTGIGIAVRGREVTLRNGSVRGFRCGVLATAADGSTFERLDLSGNYAMRLKSSSAVEDAADWLWPHENDGREWVTRYGAGLCIERSSKVTVREITVRGTQNGILLDRVSHSRVYDNDCSFLSGWGLAMWRTTDTIVCRNAFDFCIRGYSHGVYNRGQDSAGILMFEQCSRNTIALNSATHGGDGLFGFAGKEALGERLPAEVAAEGAIDFTKRRGSNDNLIVGNDFSFAAAHGLEMTFSFGNRIAHNLFEGNAICGIWGGYSQDTLITANRFVGNGPQRGAGDGLGEGGAIDIEHGQRNLIVSNSFANEAAAIELWWDDDKALLATPWAKSNGAASSDTIIAGNTFDACAIALGLRASTSTAFFGNTVVNGEGRIQRDETSEIMPVEDEKLNLPPIPTPKELAASLPGTAEPIGKRRAMPAFAEGRAAIRMTEWGPWDGSQPMLVEDSSTPSKTIWRLLGAKELRGGEVAGGGSLRLQTDLTNHRFVVSLEMPGMVAPYLMRARFNDGGVLFARGCIHAADWHVSFFPSVVDPRSNPEVWREGATSGDSITIVTDALDFAYGHGGPRDLKLSGLAGETLAAAADSPIGQDHFGMVATTRLTFPKGTFTIRTLSDDGVRVLVDGKPIIDDWSWHPPRESRGTVTFEERTEVELRVEHFELDGFATLRLFIDGEIDPARAAIFGGRR
jgi:hypothetical protein